MTTWKRRHIDPELADLLHRIASFDGYTGTDVQSEAREALLITLRILKARIKLAEGMTPP